MHTLSDEEGLWQIRIRPKIEARREIQLYNSDFADAESKSNKCLSFSIQQQLLTLIDLNCTAARWFNYDREPSQSVAHRRWLLLLLLLLPMMTPIDQLLQQQENIIPHSISTSCRR
jgi:hypothetical protein